MKKMKSDRSQKLGLNVHVNEPALTRRELIARGLQSGGGMLFLPSLYQILANPTSAFGACPTAGSDFVPMLVFDCAGGASLAGNFVVGKEGGSEDFLRSYDTMGVPKAPQNGESIDKQFGLPLYTNISMIRLGIVNATSEATRANLKMASICNASQDDSSGNMLSPAILASKAGLRGKFLNGISNFNTDSGGNSQSPLLEPSLKPLAVNSAQDLNQALGFGPVIGKMAPKQKNAIARAIQKLSESQSKRFAQFTLGEQMAELVRCGTIKNIEFTGDVEGLDPRVDPIVKKVYRIDLSSDLALTRSATIAYSAIVGNSGPGILTIDACDYHDGTQNTGDAKDFEIGTEIGRAVELAAGLMKPLFFCLISDGSTYSDPGTRIWRGDAGSKGLVVMGYYHPAGKASLIRTQLGHFTDGQGVERSTYLGNDPKRAAHAVFANYLAVNGKLGEFSKWVGASDFDASKIETHICFG